MKKIILFGDSLTAGYKDGEITAILTEKLQESLPEFQILNAGIPGETTEDGLVRVRAHVGLYQPEFVTVFFGTNDLATHHLVPLNKYRENLKQLIEEIGAEKIILITPGYSDQRTRNVDRPLERIMEYVQVGQDLGQAYQVPVIDLLSEMLKAEVATEYLQADGVHFSAKGYDLLWQLILSALNQKISVEKKE